MSEVSLELLEAVCLDIKNFFVRRQDMHTGFFAITNGHIVPSIPINTKYYRIIGSQLNDGVHATADADLIDEPTFGGAVWVMCPPKSFLAIVSDIEKWTEDNKAVIDSPYTSESFGGYSYTKATGTSGGGSDGSLSWQSHFAKRLSPYRRIRLI